MKLHIVFYSMYGHVWRVAEAVAEGAGEVAGVQVVLSQVAELVPDKTLEASGARKARAQFAHIPLATPEQLTEADVIIFGTPTRYGMMAAQMKSFIDQTGSLWAQGAFNGKVAGVFGSSNTQHCGNEATLLSFHNLLIGMGMIVAGIPPSVTNVFRVDQVSGGSLYGATTIAGSGGSRQPSDNELAIARAQGRYLAELGIKLQKT